MLADVLGAVALPCIVVLLSLWLYLHYVYAPRARLASHEVTTGLELKTPSLNQMEIFNVEALRVFVAYATLTDMQVTANRQHGRQLYTAALDSLGDFKYPADKADKLLVFLSMTELQGHQSETVAIYSFVKIVAELRRLLGPPVAGGELAA